MKTFRDQNSLAMAHREDFIEILILPIVAVNAKAVCRSEAVVIDLFQVGRTSISIVTVRGPAAPGPTRNIDLEEDQSLSRKRRRQKMIDLPQCSAPATHLRFHFLGFE